MMTASIYQGLPLMESPQRKLEWQDAFHEAAKLYKWIIVAWVVLNNHYHAIIHSPENASTLPKFIASYHKFTARKWNLEDRSTGRKVWWNYWDTCVRSERDYYNRLRYIFWNPVKHGLAEQPDNYRFSNYKKYLMQLLDFDFTGMDEVKDVPEF
jgi:putative transposase